MSSIPLHTPLNRGLNLVIGSLLITLVFVIVGPPIGGFCFYFIGALVYGSSVDALAIVGQIIMTLIAGYIGGLMPAAVTGLLFCTLWALNVSRRNRMIACAVTGAVVSPFLGPQIGFVSNTTGPLLFAVVGAISSLVCTDLAHRFIDVTEASRRDGLLP